GAAELAHRHHLVLERPDHHLQHPADFLHRRGDGGGVAVRQAEADPRAAAGCGMNELRELLSNDFLPKFLAGMVVNFEIAAIALVIGLALGLLLAAGRLSGGVVTAVTVSLISLMRAAPTFVVMFFLL